MGFEMADIFLFEPELFMRERKNSHILYTTNRIALLLHDSPISKSLQCKCS